MNDEKHESAEDIRRRLHSNPIYWIDKSCALTKALADGTIITSDPDYGYFVSEKDEANAKVEEFIDAGTITPEQVEAEIKRQMGEKS